MSDATFGGQFSATADAAATLAKMRSWFETGMPEPFQHATVTEATL